MTFTCYEPRVKPRSWASTAHCVVTNFSKAPGSYNGVEGIFPDGLYTAVEADVNATACGTRGSGNIDIWKLKLDEPERTSLALRISTTMQREASNPVILHGWPLMAFQVAKTDDPAGVGYGIVLFHFKLSRSRPVGRLCHY